MLEPKNQGRENCRLREVFRTLRNYYAELLKIGTVGGGAITYVNLKDVIKEGRH